LDTILKAVKNLKDIGLLETVGELLGEMKDT